MENLFVIGGLFLLVMVITVVAFVGWVIVRIIGLIGGTLFGWTKTVAKPPATFRRCPRDKCRADNPMEANFCRRCGVRLQAAPKILPGKAALW